MLNFINSLIIIQSTFEEETVNTQMHIPTLQEVQNQLDDVMGYKRGWRDDIFNHQSKQERFDYLCNPDTNDIYEIRKCISLLEDWKEYDEDKVIVSQVRLAQKIILIQSDVNFGKVEYVN
jgi:hypothetical protein